MKILWLCNIMLPKVAKHLSKPVNSFGGWLTGLSNDLLMREDIQLSVCFPVTYIDSLLEGQVENLKYFGFPQNKNNLNKYNTKNELYFEEIIKKVRPDIIHIFGTEYPHTLAMVKTCERLDILDKAVISIQGLVSVCALHYYASLPYKVVNTYTLRDFIRRNNIKDASEDMKDRGILEVEAIKKVKHIIGRTTWDKACTSQINPGARYHFCNETLRDEFYKHKWSFESCERYSIFTSQASYPIKGVHFVLEAMPLIIDRFPKAKLYIAGYDITKSDTLKDKLKKASYAKYLEKLIRENNLQKSVIFTGVLNEVEMCQRYLKSNVFISPSTIENESNSLSEAKILGVPCIASYVGGVTDRINHGEDGFLYQHDAPYMLAYYVCEIFEKKDSALEFSRKAREHALKTHDRENNIKRLIEIYSSMLKKA